MSFRPEDRVRWSSGKIGIVLSKPMQCDYARGDPFTEVGVEIIPDKSMYGAGATLVHVAILTRLGGPEVVVVVDLDDEETLEEIVRADPLRGGGDRRARGASPPKADHTRRQVRR